MAEQLVTIKGKRYVMVEARELRRLKRLAAQAEGAGRPDAMPQYPPADKHGNRPAVEYARVSIARTIVEDRKAAGLSQQELARLAGVRQETISRLESGKHSPTVRTVEKIDRALQTAKRKAQAKKGG
jgi:ribosome-binding protein aMBF1 (putative translation factor)